MNKESRYGLTYINGAGEERYARLRGEEKKQEALDRCKKSGFKVISCQKLYPFSTMKNQHNFDLIANICLNRLFDMDAGDVPYDEAEYDRLRELRDKAIKFFCLDLPVAWLPYEEWKDAKELSMMAILHRQECCIANGRPDLVTYC